MLSLNWSTMGVRDFGREHQQIDAYTSEGVFFATIYPEFCGTVDKEDDGLSTPYLQFWPQHPTHTHDDDLDRDVLFVVRQDIDTPSVHMESLLAAKSQVYRWFQTYCKERGYARTTRAVGPIDERGSLDAYIGDTAHDFGDFSALDAEFERLS